MIRKNVTKGGNNKGFLNKAWRSLGPGKTLAAEPSVLSQQSLPSAVADSAAESGGQKVHLMKRVVRSLSFKALPKAGHVWGAHIGEKQGSGIAVSKGYEVMSRSLLNCLPILPYQDTSLIQLACHSQT